MILLAADATTDYSVVPLLVSAIVTLGTVIVVLFWQLMKRTDSSATREREIAAAAKADGEADGKFTAEVAAKLAEASTMMKSLQDQLRSDAEDRRATVTRVEARLEKVIEAVERCQVRP